MPRKVRRSLFWIWTFIIGVFSPGKGKRRINTRMAKLEEDLIVQKSNNGVLTTECEGLRERLAWTKAEVKRLKTALCMDDAINVRTSSWAKESPDDEVDTVRIPIVN